MSEFKNVTEAGARSCRVQVFDENDPDSI